ncbi:MAG: hypothetical protein V5A23_04585 [Halobacteriales archaeon]
MRRRTLLSWLAALTVPTVAGCADPPKVPSYTATGTPTDSPGAGHPDPTADPDSPDATPTASNSPTATPPPTSLQNGSFEDGLAGWAVGRDLPDRPGNPGTPVAADVSVDDRMAADGDRSLRLAIDGSADDGTVWVQQPVDLTDHETLAVAGYSEQESFNTIAKVAAYAGPLPDGGLSEADFDTDRATEDHEGWKTYEYEIDHDGPGVVAVGMSVVWETRVLRHFDDVGLH